MKATGIVRPVDDLGRLVIPKEIRKSFDILDGGSLEIFIDEDCIVLKKYAPACIFCNEVTDVTSYKGKLICKHCISDLTSL